MKSKSWGIISGCIFVFLTLISGTAILALISWGLWKAGVYEIGGIYNNGPTTVPIAIGISAFFAIIVGILAGRFFYRLRQNHGMKPKSRGLFEPKTFGIFSGCSFGFLTFLLGIPLLVLIPMQLWNEGFQETLLIAIVIGAFLAIIVGILPGRFFYWWKQKQEARWAAEQSDLAECASGAVTFSK